MIKTIELMAEVFGDMDKQIKSVKHSTSLTKTEQKQKIADIKKSAKQKLKEIEEKYPLEQEVNKFLKEE